MENPAVFMFPPRPLDYCYREGRVVAGQDPSGPASENTAHQVTITPDRPHHARLAG